MRSPSLRLSLIAIPLVAISVGGCAAQGGEPIPAQTARALIRDINTVEDRVRAGECRKTRSTLRQLDETARTLPDDVDADLRSALTAGVTRLERLVGTQCKQKKPKPKPEPVEPEPVQPVAPPPVDTTPEPTPEPKKEPEPKKDPAPEEPEREQPKEPKQPKVDEPQTPKGDGRDPCPPGAAATC